MTNHLHLLVKTPRPNLARGMQSFLSSYALYSARRRRRPGHLFQGRYGDPDTTAGPALPTTFDFLGFTHYWGRSRAGGWVVKRKTARSRLKRALQSLSEWCRVNRHQLLPVQHQTLKQKLQGHYAYHGITGNFPSLQEFLEGARGTWKRWLSRRRRGGPMTWKDFSLLEKRYGLPRPRIVHGLLSRAAKS